MLTHWWQYLLAALAALAVVALAVGGLAIALIYPGLPGLDALTDYRPKMPLRIYTQDGALIGEFGEERRAVVTVEKTPIHLRQAILAAEDERFYEHSGVDTIGVFRAALSNILSGGVREGASTITMQVARNFFLSSERSFRRKLNEALLAIKIEHTLSKDDILQLYINHIYLGQRAYGFAAASQTYYGKSLENINLAEAAMLAGLPKAPSAYNPVVNPSRAKTRQLYVLGRMYKLGYITENEYAAAKDKRLYVRHSPQNFDAPADHVAEMVRQYMYQHYGDQIYVTGMKAYTTLLLREQLAAAAAVRKGLVDFNRRRGYAGPEGRVEIPADPAAREEALEEALVDLNEVGGLLPAIVLSVDKKRIVARLQSGEDIELGGSELKYAQRFLASGVPEKKRLQTGSVVRVVRLPGQSWQLTHLPELEAALIALSPEDGAIRALVGGFDFSRNQFNHVTQAWRQPGSSFKPFVYSAALDRGLTPATVMEDAPFTLDPAETGGVLWEPKNFDGEMEGPITLRNALRKSKNLVTIRVLEAIGIETAREHAARFGFDMSRIPPYLTMSLGAGEVTPLGMATAYAVFANGGMLIRPYYLSRVTDKDGKVLEDYRSEASERVLDARNAYIMTSLMQDVIRRGTATAALSLGRGDLAGKTGTTNDHRDAWFTGYSPKRVAVAWVGYDTPRPMGAGETGSRAALPIWMDYMAGALAGEPDKGYNVPEGVVVVRVNPKTGTPVREGEEGMLEYFYEEFSPLSMPVDAFPAEQSSPFAPPVLIPPSVAPYLAPAAATNPPVPPPPAPVAGSIAPPGAAHAPGKPAKAATN